MGKWWGFGLLTINSRIPGKLYLLREQSIKAYVCGKGKSVGAIEEEKSAPQAKISSFILFLSFFKSLFCLLLKIVLTLQENHSC